MSQYATTDDVVQVLGKLGPRVQRPESGIDLDAHLAMGDAEARDRLARAYGRSVPDFAGPGLESVRWAVAQLAAARVLDVLRGSLDTVSDLPERLRRTAWSTLEGVPGYPVGDAVPGPPEGTAVAGGPRASDSTAMSNFADPYEDARVAAAGGRLVWDSFDGWRRT